MFDQKLLSTKLQSFNRCNEKLVSLSLSLSLKTNLLEQFMNVRLNKFILSICYFIT